MNPLVPQPRYTLGQRYEVPLAEGITMAFRYIPPTEPEGFRTGSRGYHPQEDSVDCVVLRKS